jgi:hypothetical protein
MTGWHCQLCHEYCACSHGCRLQELESQHKGFQQEQEAAEFEKLQMKFGFSDKVSTSSSRLPVSQPASWYTVMVVANNNDVSRKQQHWALQKGVHIEAAGQHASPLFAVDSHACMGAHSFVAIAEGGTMLAVHFCYVCSGQASASGVVKRAIGPGTAPATQQHKPPGVHTVLVGAEQQLLMLSGHQLTHCRLSPACCQPTVQDHALQESI